MTSARSGVGSTLDGPWQDTLTVQSDGTVIVSGPNGLDREFQPDSRGSDYLDQPGDHGTLTNDGDGTFTLKEADGSLTYFLADGQVGYIQDTKGNRIKAGYTNGLLTSLTQSDGQSLQISYNGAGLITQVTDPYGRETRFTYDPTDTYLLLVQNADGTTQTYTYNTSSGPAVSALTSVADATDATQSFTYDSLGRLSGISREQRRRPNLVHVWPGRRGRRNRCDKRHDSVVLRRRWPAGQDDRPAGESDLRVIRRQLQPRLDHRRRRPLLPVYL